MTKFPGEKFLIKMWDSLIDKGAGGLLKPWQMRREGVTAADIKHYDIIMTAQAEKYAEDIKNGTLKIVTDSKKLLLPAHKHAADNNVDMTPNILPIENVTTQMLVDNVRKEVNISKAILYAEAELKDDDTPMSDKNIDDDWLYRWRTAASDFSSDELQQLWGKVLAGEVKSPGVYSFRTIDFIRNLSQEEAVMITKLAPFVNYNFIYRSDIKNLEKFDISFEFLLHMQELGILTSVDATGLIVETISKNKQSFETTYLCNDRILMVTHLDPNIKCINDVYAVTKLGMQIFALGNFSANEEYLKIFAQSIAKKGFTVKMAKLNYFRKDTFNYEYDKNSIENIT